LDPKGIFSTIFRCSTGTAPKGHRNLPRCLLPRRPARPAEEERRVSATVEGHQRAFSASAHLHSASRLRRGIEHLQGTPFDLDRCAAVLQEARTSHSRKCRGEGDNQHPVCHEALEDPQHGPGPRRVTFFSTAPRGRGRRYTWRPRLQGLSQPGPDCRAVAVYGCATSSATMGSSTGVDLKTLAELPGPHHTRRRSHTSTSPGHGAISNRRAARGRGTPAGGARGSIADPSRRGFRRYSDTSATLQ